MLILKFSGVDSTYLKEKYNDKVIELETLNSDVSNDELIEYIEKVRESIANYEIVIIPYIQEVILCLDTLAIKYTVVFPTEIDSKRIEGKKDEYQIFKTLAINNDIIVLNVDETLEHKLLERFDWIELNQDKSNMEDKSVKDTVATEVTEAQSTNEKLDVSVSAEKQVQKPSQPLDGKRVTLQELIEQDIDITEADVREMKSMTNKFKVAMILQAKSRLHTVLKLCGVLDKLYDELVDRIDLSLKTTDTASLMYTADYISKALSDTNQFIMSLITNEKIQNFFIIDNSNIINITDNKVDIDKREKIRKAAEIVLDNAEYFTSGQYDKVVNPNTVFVDDTDNSVSEGDNNASTTT